MSYASRSLDTDIDHLTRSGCESAGRAAAAAGQTGLMALYDSLFTMLDMTAAQLLVTAADFEDSNFRENLTATAEDLLSMNVIPVFNENDAVISSRISSLVRSSPEIKQCR